MSRVSVQGIVGSSSPSDRALVRDAGGEPRCDPAKIPKEIACLPCERSSSFQAFATCLHVGTTASPQAARMPVGLIIVPDSSEARGMSREAPSDAQQCRMGGGCGRREHFWARLRLRAAGRVFTALVYYYYYY